MFFKLLALELVMANPTPLLLHPAGNRWFKVGKIDGINIADIDNAVWREWGLTIDDFKSVVYDWFEHDGKRYDAAFTLNLDTGYWSTVFYQRNHY